MNARRLKRGGIAVIAAGLALASSASTAVASETVGQLFAPFGGACSPIFTYLQTGVESGNSYVVPIAGVITSWSFQDGNTIVTGLKLKVARPSGGNNYTIVGESAAGPQTPNAINPYPANIPVQANDVIGISEGGGDCSMGTLSALDNFVYKNSDVPPSSTPTTFTSSSMSKIPVQATVTEYLPAPSNQFTFGKSVVKKNGSALLPATFPGPGSAVVEDAGLASAPASISTKKKRLIKTVTTAIATAGTMKLKIKPTSAAKKKLKQGKTVKVRVKVTFTPSGGTALSQIKAVKLKKKAQH